MEASGDPVQSALEERRARRVVAERLECGLTLADRCRDAAERRLRIRAFLIGNTTAGTALAADETLLTIDTANGVGPARRAHLAVDALVRLTVAEGHARPRTPPAAGPGAPAIVCAVAELADGGSDLAVVTRDGSTVRGPLISLGDRALGFGGPGTSIDWVDPSRIVSVARIAQPAADPGRLRR